MECDLSKFPGAKPGSGSPKPIDIERATVPSTLALRLRHARMDGIEWQEAA